MRVSFIGLGQMGTAMARNLIAAGHSLTIFNRTASKAEAFRSLGATIAETPAGVAAGAEVIITMLADDRALEQVMFAPGHTLDALPAGTLHISMSTISVDLSQRLTDRHRASDRPFVSAPVFGRPEAAAAAKLFVVAAGAPADIERCRPLFEALGQKTLVAGPNPPDANIVKIAGNFLLTTVIESLGEACALVKKSGLDPRGFLDILTGTLFTAPVYRTYGNMIATDTFEPAGFKLPLGLKDNRLVLSAADALGVPMPIANLVHDRFLAALAQGMEQADWAGIARLSYQGAGLLQ